jgi:hypothetical protein
MNPLDYIREQSQKLQSQLAATKALHRELAQMLEDFQQHKPHRELLLGQLSTFDSMLEAAGFRLASSRAFQATVNSGAGRFDAWAWSAWRHPDCSIASETTLTLRIRGFQVFQGEADAKFTLYDRSQFGGSPGVLAERPFSEVLELAPRMAFSTSEQWLAHIQQGVLRLNLATLQGTFDRALHHIERATTP